MSGSKTAAILSFMLPVLGALFASFGANYYDLGWAATAVVFALVMGSIGLVSEAAGSRLEQRPIKWKDVVVCHVMVAGGMVGAIALTISGWLQTG